MEPQPQSTNVSAKHWYTFLFLAGLTSTAVEITGLRLLAPLFGSSLPVWGSVIAIVLGGLAWGYTIGGKRAEHPLTAHTVFQRAAIGAALFIWMPPAFQLATFLRNRTFESGSPLPILGSLAIAGLILLIPSIVFGIVTPLAIQVEAQRRQQSPGHVAGRIFTLTTLGSLVGILLPSLLTIPLLGTRLTVWLVSAAILLTALPPLLRRPAAQATGLVILLGVAISTIPFNRDQTIILEQETAHQHVTVRQAGNQRLLTFDAAVGVQSLYTTNTYTNAYWDYPAALPLYLDKTDQPIDILVLGAAASSAERQLARLWGDNQQFNFTSVEIDHAVTEIADTYFDPPERNIVIADARWFVAKDTKQYDIILLDTYTQELTVPFHLVTTEFFEQVKDRLKPNGVLAVNANSTFDTSLWLRSLSRTLSHVFADTKIAAIPRSCNHLLLAGKQPLTIKQQPSELIQPLASTFENATTPNTDGLLLTDDRAPTDWLGIVALLAAEQTSCGERPAGA